ncbi:hypothetical protein [uncultured Dysosmobacter sp.]|uniref:hypothetical protein n=1 Tax=uncultured Dysosmobacter sp. TaxID=2591384 RepID=UPI0026216C4F|nr:hypothetical protein [uncultured Dysosmobacter sp.]
MKSVIEAIRDSSKGFVNPSIEEICRDENDRTKAAVDALEKALGLDDGSYAPERAALLDMMTELESAREELGFLNGFRVAVRLMTECAK